MKNFVQELKLNFILTALFCILCGAVLFVWPDMSARIACMVPVSYTHLDVYKRQVWKTTESLSATAP